MGATASVVESSQSTNTAQKAATPKIDAGSNNLQAPVFPVSLAFWSNKHIALPNRFLLRIAYESLDFVCMDDRTTPIIQFPYQNIICWGSSLNNFQFKIFDLNNSDPEKRLLGMLISVYTNQGKAIEDATMSTVRKLMADINARAISKEEFACLLDVLFDANNLLAENWMEIINQFTIGGRLFLAKQAMELLIRVGSQAPFEKVELACLLYERMINKSSVQLIVNTFEDAQERDNLIHRLKLNINKYGTVVVTTCAILPEVLT